MRRAEALVYDAALDLIRAYPRAETWDEIRDLDAQGRRILAAEDKLEDDGTADDVLAILEGKA